MRAIAPRPAATRAVRALANAGSSSSNIAGSSSQGSRLTSMKARASSAAISVWPKSGAAAISSSTCASSERRIARRSSCEAAIISLG